MDSIWLNSHAFLSQQEIAQIIKETFSCFFMSGNAHAFYIADLCSMFHPESRQLFVGCLATYKHHDNPNTRRIVEYAEKILAENTASWISTSSKTVDELSNLQNDFSKIVRRLLACYRPAANASLKASDETSLDFDEFYWEVRWFLGRLLYAYPQIHEEYRSNVSLAILYDKVEFILKDLENEDNRIDSYPENPESFLVKIDSFCQEDE